MWDSGRGGKVKDGGGGVTGIGRKQVEGEVHHAQSQRQKIKDLQKAMQQ